MAFAADHSLVSMEEDQEKKFLEFESKFIRRLYALMDALESSWPKFMVYCGMVIEIIQMAALLFNYNFTWGPIIQIFSVAIRATLLPFWDDTFVVSFSFMVNGVLLAVLFVALIALYVLLYVEHSEMDVRSVLQFPRFTRLFLYAMIGPLFLPSLQLILSLSVCTGGNGNSDSNHLAEFPEKKCFAHGDEPWMIVFFVIAMLSLVMLVVPKVIISVAVYDDMPISESIRARPHSLVEGWMVVYLLLFSALSHYLPEIGQREAFALIFAVASFLICFLHIFYIPFYDRLANRLRVIGYSIIGFAGLLMGIGLAVGDSSPIFTDNDMDIAVLIPGALVVAVLGYALTLFRVSSEHRRDIARAKHAEIRPEKFKRRMFYPWYLPTAELRRFHANRYVLDARHNVVVHEPANGSASASRNSKSLNTAGTSTVLNSSILRNLHREIEEMAKFEMTCYIDSIYCSTDVELATRFMISFTRVTNTSIPDHLLEYGMGIYNKGLNRFVRDSWLQLQFANFLCCYFSRTNHVSMALCEELHHRQLGPVMSYRLHRCSSSISDQRIRRNQAARQHLQHAMKVHKDTLVHMQLFWRRMLNERIDVTILGEASMTIINGCSRGVRYYKSAITQRTDSVILSRYAQFLEDVVLAPEAAEYAREIAADMFVKQEQGVAQEDLHNDKIISAKQKLGARYGRITRNLRIFLLVMCTLILALIVALFAVILSTYVRSDRILASLYAAASFRFYSYRAMWLVDVAANTSNSDVLWNMLEDDLTRLRNLYKELTFGKYKATNVVEKDNVEGSYYNIIYGRDIFPLENAGFWRAGEVFLDALETLVLYRTSAYSRTSARTLIRGNELSGFSAAFNASLVGFQDVGNSTFIMAVYVVVVLFVAVVVLVFVTFFVFRYYLTRITGMGMMALSLFQLIPRNSLETMVDYLGEKIEHFEEPDAELARLIRERKMTGYLGAELTEAEQFDNASESSSQSVIPTLAPINSNEGVGGGGPGGLGAGAAAAAGGLGAGGVGAGGGGAVRGRKPSDESSAAASSKFDLLARNSSVADVGRIKMHQGQYEPPYQKGYFPPRVLTEEEKRQRQDEINDIEVEASLNKIRESHEANKLVTGSSDQLDEGVTYFAPISIDSSNDVFKRKVTIVLAIIISVVTIAIGVLDIFMISSMNSNRDTSIPLLEQMNMYEQDYYNYMAALEAFVYLATETGGTTTTEDILSDINTAMTTMTDLASSYAVASVQFFQRSSAQKSAQFIVSLQQYNYYANVIVDQLLAAGRLACSVIIPPAGSDMVDCSFFNSYTYSADIFLPNQTENVIFDRDMKLPQGWDVDSLLTEPERAVLAINVMSSPYYSSVLNESALTWEGVRDSILVSNQGNLLDSELKFHKVASSSCFALSILLFVLVVGQAVQTGLYGTNSLVFICSLLSTCLACAVLGLQIYFFLSKMPLDGPYQNCVSVLTYVSNIYTMQMIAFENVKQCSFADSWLGATDFGLVNGPRLFESWNGLFEKLGSDYLETLINSYSYLQHAFYLTSIIIRIAVSYVPGMPTEFSSLPIIKTCEWDLSRETRGFRLQLTYDGTPQKLYSNKAADLALPDADKKALTYSLAFGTWRSGEFTTGMDYLNKAVKAFVTDQLKVADHRYRLQFPMTVAATVLAFFIALVNIIVVVFLIVFLMEVYHTRKGLRRKNSSVSHGYDRGFAQIVRWSFFLNVLFVIVLIALAIFVVVHYLNLLNSFRRLNVLNLRESRLLESDIALTKGVDYPWFLAVAKYFAESTAAAGDEYYRTVHLSFWKNLPPLLFGGVHNVSYVRYNKELALDDSLTRFEDQSPLLAFENYVDPSLRNWRQRVLEMLTMSSANRYAQNNFLEMPVYNLSDYCFASTTVAHTDLQSNRSNWLIVHIIFFLALLTVFLFMAHYMLFPVVGRLRQEEEGTQVVLQMIPPHIRQAIPAIYNYMKTGTIVQDTNAVEIDQISKDLSVVPIITINTAGKIRQFSRAAEESFLWTRSEAIGQNVRILMPDNVAEEHDRYLQNYLKTGVKYMIGNSRAIRAKRKDGTLFAAILEVSEFHTGSELLFVGAIHVSQETVELERSSVLSKALTDASTIPIVVCDTDGIIQSFSKSAEEAFKTSAEDIVGQKVNMLMPRSDAEMHDLYMERYVRTKQASIINKHRLMRGKRMNGELFPIRIMVREFQLSGRSLFVAYIEDMTNRLRQEMVAAAGEVMQEKCPVPMLVTDMDGRVVQCSSSIRHICGVNASEVIGRDIRFLVKDESVMDLVEKVKNNPRGIMAHIDDFHIVECTAMRRTEDGVDGTFQARITTRLFNWHTKGPHLMLFLEDLTNIQALDLNCRIGNAVMSLSSVPIVVVRENGAIVQMSSAAEVAFRCFAGDAYDKSIDLLFVQGDSLTQHPQLNGGMRGSPVGGMVGILEPHDEDESTGSSDGSHVLLNPVARVLEEYSKSGTTSLCGRVLKGLAKRTDSGAAFPVEVIVKEVDQGDERLFLAYIRNTTEDHRLLEVTAWNDAYMSLTPIPIVCSNLEGTIFACSDSTCSRFGWTREELIGSNVSVLMPPRYAADHARFMAQFKETLENTYKEGERKSILNRRSLFIGRAQDGEEFPVTVGLRDVHLEGADSFIVASLRPSQQDMELEALSKVSATMSALSPCPFICINAYGVVTEFSRSAQEAFGYAEHEVVGQNVSMLQTPDVAIHHDGYLRAYQKTGMKHLLDQTVPVVAKKKDGTLMNIELSVKEVRNENVLEFIGYLRDVTGKQTTRQMVALDELVELEAASPMVELDYRGNITEVRCLDRDFGYIKRDLLGKSILTILPDGYGSSDESWVQSAIRELTQMSRQSATNLSIQQQQQQQMTWVSRRLFGRHKDGSEFWCEVVMGEITYATDVMATAAANANANANANAKGKNKSGRAARGRDDMRIVMYVRNLQQEVLLELCHGINNTATDIFPVPLVTMSTNGMIRLFNRAAEETFAYTAKEAVGKPMTTFIMPSEIQRLQNALEQLRAPSSEFFMETVLDDLQMRRKGSSGPIGMSLVLQRLTDANNQPYLLGTFRDPTNDLAGEAEETLSNVLVSFSTVPIIVTDHRGVIEQFSAGAEVFLGYTQLDVEGKDVGMIRAHLASLEGQDKKIHNAQDFLRASMTFTESTQLPVSIREQIVIKKKNGQSAYASIHIHSIIPYKKKLPRFVAYIQDRSDVMNNQKPLERLNCLIDSSLSGVIVIAAHGVVVHGNPTAHNVLGYERGSMVQLAVSNIIAGDNRSSSKLLRAISHVMEATKENGLTSISAVQVRDAELVCKGGSRIAVDAVVATVLPSSGHELMRVAINFIDVASEKKTQVCEDREAFLEDVSGVIAMEIDTNGNFLRVNENFLNLLEYEMSDMIGHSWVSFVPKGDKTLQHSMELAMSVSKQGVEMHVEHVNLTFVGKSGRSVKMDGEMKSVVRSDGSMCSLIGCLHPVQLSDTQLTQLAMTSMDTSDASLIICTVDGSILSANSTTHRIFDIPSDATVVGQRLTMFFPPDFQKDSLSRFQRLVVEGSTEIVRGISYPQYTGSSSNNNNTSASVGKPKATTFALELKVVALREEDGAKENNGGSLSRSRASRRSSVSSGTYLDKVRSDRQPRSSLLLVRMRRVNEKHQLSLMRSALESALTINAHANFTMDEEGLITAWSPSAHKLLCTPAPVGKNVMDIVFDAPSSHTLRNLLLQFRKQRILGELTRIILTAKYYVPAAAAPSKNNSNPAAPDTATTAGRSIAGVDDLLGAVAEPAGVMSVEFLCREAKNEQGSLVSNELLCFIRKAPNGNSSRTFSD